MHRLAIVPQGFLREAFRITALPRPLRLGVAIRVQADSVNAQTFTTLLELRGPVAGPDGSEVGEERAAGRRRLPGGREAVKPAEPPPPVVA